MFEANVEYVDTIHLMFGFRKLEDLIDRGWRIDPRWGYSKKQSLYMRGLVYPAIPNVTAAVGHRYGHGNKLTISPARNIGKYSEILDTTSQLLGDIVDVAVRRIDVKVRSPLQQWELLRQVYVPWKRSRTRADENGKHEQIHEDGFYTGLGGSSQQLSIYDSKWHNLSGSDIEMRNMLNCQTRPFLNQLADFDGNSLIMPVTFLDVHSLPAIVRDDVILTGDLHDSLKIALASKSLTRYKLKQAIDHEATLEFRSACQASWEQWLTA